MGKFIKLNDYVRKEDQCHISNLKFLPQEGGERGAK